jgi:hypothetical protein
MFAMLFPEKLADAAMAQAEHMANDPVPRITALESEIDEMSYVEKALVEAAIARGETVHGLATALLQAVLGVRIAVRGLSAA